MPNQHRLLPSLIYTGRRLGLLALLLFSLALAACGQKGALYYPETATQQVD
jgi:predicted small lipoprotein YifL